MMTVGSGEKLSVLYPSQSPIGSFLRTLLGSSTWGSTEYLLKWKAEAWYERQIRIITIGYSHDRKTCTSEYLRSTSKRWDMKSPHHLRFRLVHLTPPTFGQDIGLWGTPVVKYNRRGEKFRKGREPLPSEELATWPTPRAGVPGSRKPGTGGKILREELKKSTWPTPTSGDRRGPGSAQQGIHAIARATWSTPKSSPSGPDYARRNREGSGGDDLATQAADFGTTPAGFRAPMKSFVVYLVTLSAWLMGYTIAYLKHWETRSSGKSQRK